MKKIIRIICITGAVLSALVFSGCYSSSYSAVALVHSSTSHEGYMNFYKFNGTMVFKLDADDGKVKCSGKLDKGKAAVYYDYEGEKKKLCELDSGDTLSDKLDVPKDSSVYIIVETDSQCESGELTFKT